MILSETGVSEALADDLVRLGNAIRQLDIPCLPEVSSTRSLIAADQAYAELSEQQKAGKIDFRPVAELDDDGQEDAEKSKIFIIRSISQPLNRLAQTMNNIRESGNLTLRADVEGRDEFAEMTGDFNAMIDNFHQLTANTHNSAEEVQGATEQLNTVASDTKEAMDRQQVEIEQIATAMNEMAATVQEVARNVANTADAANKANSEAGAVCNCCQMPSLRLTISQWKLKKPQA